MQRQLTPFQFSEGLEEYFLTEVVGVTFLAPPPKGTARHRFETFLGGMRSNATRAGPNHHGRDRPWFCLVVLSLSRERYGLNGCGGSATSGSTRVVPVLLRKGFRRCGLLPPFAIQRAKKSHEITLLLVRQFEREDQGILVRILDTTLVIEIHDFFKRFETAVMHIRCAS